MEKPPPDTTPGLVDLFRIEPGQVPSDRRPVNGAVVSLEEWTRERELEREVPCPIWREWFRQHPNWWPTIPPQPGGSVDEVGSEGSPTARRELVRATREDSPEARQSG